MRWWTQVLAGAVALAGLAASGGDATAAESDGQDRGAFASNNGFIPDPAKYPNLPLRALNHDYPREMPKRSWRDVKPAGRITVATAQDYMRRLKAYVEPSLRGMIETPGAWSPGRNGWYDMPWMARSEPDCPFEAAADGREAILGSYSGQIILKQTFGAVARPDLANGLKVDTQNHTVIYYDPVAALTLGEVWADPDRPKTDAVAYREGALVVKAGAIAATPEEWPVVAGAAEWQVYRPPVPAQREAAKACADKTGHANLVPVVTTARVVQFDVIVKDSEASPETGWVFTTFVYDKDAPGRTPWDKLVPLGAMWGNDPEDDRYFCGIDDRGTPLAQTWIDARAPLYIRDTLGWGGRMSGPIDLAKRHGVEFTCDAPVAAAAEAPQLARIALARRQGREASCASLPAPTALAEGSGTALAPVGDAEIRAALGTFRVSSCLSCHGTAQTGKGANLYPSCQTAFPPDGQPFPLFRPGTQAWAQWFQNRPGRQPQVAAAGVTGLDYDMLFMFAIGAAQRANGVPTLIAKRVPVH